MKKVIIAGSRHFIDYPLLREECDKLVKEGVEIVSGGARGADLNGEKYARERGFPIKRFSPDWATHGMAAGPIRNAQMAKYADMAIVFWDGKSRGAKDMIIKMRGAKKPVTVVRIPMASS